MKNNYTITNGATMYPLFAALCPQFIIGSDIVMPFNCEEIFIRNLGTNAGSEFTVQLDEVGPHTHKYNDPTIGVYKGLKYDGDGTAVEYVTTNGGTTLVNTGIETRPKNIASQFYIVIDTPSPITTSPVYQ